MTAVQTQTGMETVVTQEDRFLFDLQGFLMLRGALAEEDRAVLLEEVERLEAAEFDDSRFVEPGKTEPPVPTKDVTGDTMVRLNSLLRNSTMFDRLIDYPTVLPYLEAFMDRPQFGNLWSITKFQGAAYGGWHRGVSPEHYTVRAGKINSRMLNTVWFLTDNGPDDGGMIVLPGGHKSQFDPDWSQYTGVDIPGSKRVTGNAGDVLIFSETVMHTGVPKTTPGKRTNLYANYVTRDFNGPTYSPELNYQFVMPEHVRERFTEKRKALTEWMAYAVSVD